MAGILSVSRKSLMERRKKLQRQRQIKILQNIWRTLAVTGLASGLFWLSVQPIWVLENPDQIVVKSGDEVLNGKDISNLIGLSYPQSLWKIEPGEIAESLKKKPTISQAIVTRRLLPPGLIIEIEERLPVAIAQIPLQEKLHNCHSDNKSPDEPCSINSKNQQGDLILLDIHGGLIPIKTYKSLNPKFQLPQLKVLGNPREYKPFWNQLYQAIGQNYLQVKTIDYRDPSNLILTTELGNFHLGNPTNKLPEQLQLIGKMRNLTNQFNPGEIDYIDLKNPDKPILVQKNQKNPSKDKNAKKSPKSSVKSN